MRNVCARFGLAGRGSPRERARNARRPIMVKGVCGAALTPDERV
jgi:hypothetical protein